MRKLIASLFAALVMVMAAGCTLLPADLRPAESGPAVKTSSAPDPVPTRNQYTDTGAIPTTVVRIIDGDTIAVAPVDGELEATNDRGDEHVVRLLGIDAPEVEKSDGTPAQCGGDRAEQVLAEMIRPGSDVEIIYDPVADRTDRYGRSLAYVEAGDQVDLAYEMAGGGYVAAWYPSDQPQPERFLEYSTVSKRAAQAQMGYWADCDDLGR